MRRAAFREAPQTAAEYLRTVSIDEAGAKALMTDDTPATWWRYEFYAGGLIQHTNAQDAYCAGNL